MAVNSYTWVSGGASNCHSETQTSAPAEPWSGLTVDANGFYSAAGACQEYKA